MIHMVNETTKNNACDIRLEYLNIFCQHLLLQFTIANITTTKFTYESICKATYTHDIEKDGICILSYI